MSEQCGEAGQQRQPVQQQQACSKCGKPHRALPILHTRSGKNYRLFRCDPCQYLTLVRGAVKASNGFRCTQGDFDPAYLKRAGRTGVVFNDLATAAVGKAFDSACEELHDKGQPPIVYEVIATRIIEAAKKGERDPVRLRDAGLAALAPSTDRNS